MRVSLKTQTRITCIRRWSIVIQQRLIRTGTNHDRTDQLFFALVKGAHCLKFMLSRKGIVDSATFTRATHRPTSGLRSLITGQGSESQAIDRQRADNRRPSGANTNIVLLRLGIF